MSNGLINGVANKFWQALAFVRCADHLHEGGRTIHNELQKDITRMVPAFSSACATWLSKFVKAETWFFASMVGVLSGAKTGFDF